MNNQTKNTLITIEEYHQMARDNLLHEDSRVELIEGEILKMTPIGRMHAGIVNYLNQKFSQYPDQCLVQVQNPIQLGEFNEPEPDISLIKPRNDFYKNKTANQNDVLLLIEVSDSTYAFDRKTKLPLYAKFKIPEVWLLDIASRTVEMYAKPDGDSYTNMRQFQGDEIIGFQYLPDFHTTPKAIFGE